jgi:hypothetical protein
MSLNTHGTIDGDNGDAGDTEISKQISAMDDQFRKAIQAQTAITFHKTQDDTMLDASKQRPSG